ncbi:GntR family transcriptional regulator [Puniceibacterium confluentis]|uniref:GntR family transcriptional regulator n=1 Tax=Puniceibacterium confluentis TaxID=1958944 RepID=UPI0035689160
MSLIGASKSAVIAHTLEAEIRSGQLGRGDALGSENALVRRFAVSRNTVRKGLEILADKGLITTRSGIGSFVTFGGTPIDSAAGWSVALASSGDRLSSRVLALQRRACEITDGPLGAGADCLCVDRLRFRDSTGQGVSLERSRIPWRSSLADVLDSGLRDGSLDATLKAHGLIGTSGEEWANVLTSLAPEDARLMGRDNGQPMLRLRRLTRGADGAVIEFVESILDPDLFALHMEF